MEKFLDKDFLLSSETAKMLYHDFAANLPILDYHCHINPEDIAKDKKFENIAQVWLCGDHYKWRLMRANGIEEKYITGIAPDREKFQKWAETIELAIGNPLYHWSHLELNRYFGYEGVLNGDTAEEVWTHSNAKLEKLSAKAFINNSNVKLICTTDDPADSLQWHEEIARNDLFTAQVLPTWRPDRAMNIEKPNYLAYLETLSGASNLEINSFNTLKQALILRLDFFEQHGCLLSDHGLEYLMYKPASDQEICDIFSKRFAGGVLNKEEELKFKTAFMAFMGREYHHRKWTMQIHYGCKRDNNTLMFDEIGPDTGFDAINNFTPSCETAEFLNALNSTGELPKTILYSLNPNDNAIIGTIIGCFQQAGAVGKIQHGSAWWFNDHKTGITEQIISLANQGLLGNFIGMLTDSRSFLSYVRHEYFRRILCDIIGRWVENGECSADMASLQKIIKRISYNNAVRYFGFKLEAL